MVENGGTGKKMTPLFSLYIVHGLLPHHRNSRLGFQDGDDDGWLLDNTRYSCYYSRVSNKRTASFKLHFIYGLQKGTISCCWNNSKL